MPPSRSPRPRERGRTSLTSAASWALALLGAACLALTAWALLSDVRPLVVRTGSMAPELPVGTVVVVRPQPAGEVARGDVVAVRRTDGVRIMHRVHSLRAAGGGGVTLVLRGDRNRAADPPVTVHSVERPVLTIPSAGRPLTWLRGPWAQYWMGVATGALALAWVALRRRRGEREQAEAAARAPTESGPLHA